MTSEIITIATHETDGLARLVESIDRVGSSLTVEGFGEFFAGFGWRFKKLKKAIEESQAEIIIHCDAFDVVCVEPIDTLIDRFSNMKDPILFSSERNAQPEPWLWVNPALMITRRDAFLDYFTDARLEACLPDHFNDMFVLQNLYAQDKAFAIDFDNVCFFTQVPNKLLSVRNAALIDPVSGNSPTFVHGPQKMDLSNVESVLDLTVTVDKTVLNEQP